MKLPSIEKRVLPTVGAVVALVIGFLSGLSVDKGPAPPTIGEIRTVVGGATNAVRTDLKMIDAKLSNPPAKTEVIVTPVKTETVMPKKPSPPKKKAPKDAGFFSWFKS